MIVCQECALLLSVVCLSLCCLGSALKVSIDYSFPLPEQLGVATPASAKCCPHIPLPDNAVESMTLPSIVGIGVQKAGTRSAYNRLIVHPEMVHGYKKELHFLDRKNASLKSYLSSWIANVKDSNVTDPAAAQIPANSRLFEISPSYIYVAQLQRAEWVLPNAKFFVFLREPVSRAYSGFAYLKMRRGTQNPPPDDWTLRSFWNVTYEAILENEGNPQCDFHSGEGIYSYNDCLGCLINTPYYREECQRLLFVTVHATGEPTCSGVGTQMLLRGMYAAQLAWWFTLFPPSQIHIMDSARFFEDPFGVMQELTSFLELKQEYTEEMINRGVLHGNPGVYEEEDQEMVDATKSVLREYYRRPNLELYRLLHETGYHSFAPFEEELRDLDSIDCHDAAVLKTGICGIDAAATLELRWNDVKVENPMEREETAALLERLKGGTEVADEVPQDDSTPTTVVEVESAEDPHRYVHLHVHSYRHEETKRHQRALQACFWFILQVAFFAVVVNGIITIIRKPRVSLFLDGA